MTTPDAAILWARKYAAETVFAFSNAQSRASLVGVYDEGTAIQYFAEAYRAGQSRAGQSANAERVAVLTALLKEAADEIEAEVEAKRGTVLLRTTERDLDIVRRIRAALGEQP
jgi:hypothetical protein